MNKTVQKIMLSSLVLIIASGKLKLDCHSMSPPNVTLVAIKKAGDISVEFQTFNNSIHLINARPKEIASVLFTCTSNLPIEWIFKCVRFPSYAVLITKIATINSDSNQNIYASNLTINQKQEEDIFQSEGLDNATCRIISFSNLNTSIHFLESGLEDRQQVSITSGNYLNISCKGKNNKSNSSNPCPVELRVNKQTSTYICTSSSLSYKNGTLTDAITDCSKQLDYCRSYFKENDHIYTEKCVKYTVGTEKYPKSIPTTLRPGFISCKTQDEDYVYAFYYAIIKRNNKTIFYNSLELPESLQFVSDGSEEYYDKIVAEFKCAGFLQIFFETVFYLKYNNGKEIAEVLPASVESESIEGRIVQQTSLLLNESFNMSEIICSMKTFDSFMWKNVSKKLFIRASVLPKVISSEIIDNGNATVTFQCNGTGIPYPKIRWKQRILTDASDESLGKGKGALGNCDATDHVSWCFSWITIRNYSGQAIICVAENGRGNSLHEFTNKESSSGIDSILKVVAVVVSVLTILILLGVVIVLIRKVNTKQKIELPEYECTAFYQGNKAVGESFDALHSALMLAYDVNLEVPRNEIKIKENVLGFGQGGIVKEGVFQGQIVAVKTIKTAEISHFKALLCELKILQYIGKHPNIVNLIGANTANIRKMEAMLLLDFCPNGNLVKFLRSCRPYFIDFYHFTCEDISKIPLYENSSVRSLTTRDLLRFALQIAMAMDFVASKHILHGDIAARNCLVGADKNVKLCDFGLAKQLATNDYAVYIQKQEVPLPLRWMAIESLKDLEFSIQSDVWSYAVYLGELFTLAELPYAGLDWGFDSFKILQDGYRMDKPQYANVSIYLLMRNCWRVDPSERPKFNEIIDALQKELVALQHI